MTIQQMKQCVGASCEVRSMDNDLLFGGRVRSWDDDTLDLISDDDEPLPMTYIKQPVKVNIFSSAVGRITLGGQTYICNTDFWRLSNVRQFEFAESRSFFRVKFTGQAAILLDPDQPLAGTNLRERMFIVKMCDISLCGVGFIADRQLRQGQVMRVHRMHIVENEEPFDFIVKLRRMGRETIDGHNYGASIEEIEERELDRLCKAVFALQREEILRRRIKKIHR